MIENLEALLKFGAAKVVLVLAGILLVLVTFLGLWIGHLRNQRDAARLEVQRLNLTLEGYRLAQKERLAAAAQEARLIGLHTSDLVLDLQKDLPKTDEEARQWALKAAGRIR